MNHIETHEYLRDKVVTKENLSQEFRDNFNVGTIEIIQSINANPSYTATQDYRDRNSGLMMSAAEEQRRLPITTDNVVFFSEIILKLYELYHRDLR